MITVVRRRRPTYRNVESKPPLHRIALCALVIWLVADPASSLAQQRVGDSPIVELTCQGPGEFRGSATGFFVNTAGNFVTARHVIESLEILAATDGCVIVAIVSQHGWSRRAKTLRVNECMKSPQQDLAVCRADPNPFDSLGFTASPAYMLTTKQDHGATVVASGFPGDAMFKEPALVHATVALYDNMQFECKPFGGRWAVLSGPSVWLKSSQLSAATTEGMSGGPVLLSREQHGEDDVVAMFVCFGAQHIIAIPADSIVKFLHLENVWIARRSEPFVRLP